MPVRAVSSPCTSPVSARTCDTPLTPSTLAISSPSAAPKETLSPLSRMNGAWTWSVTAPSTEERRPAPSTATTVTSVSPIIRAAAVDAVRLGLRMTFQLARDATGAPAGPTDQAGERLHEPRGRQRDADEQRDHAETEQQRHAEGAD